MRKRGREEKERQEDFAKFLNIMLNYCVKFRECKGLLAKICNRSYRLSFVVVYM